VAGPGPGESPFKGGPQERERRGGRGMKGGKEGGRGEQGGKERGRMDTPILRCGCAPDRVCF